MRRSGRANPRIRSHRHTGHVRSVSRRHRTADGLKGSALAVIEALRANADERIARNPLRYGASARHRATSANRRRRGAAIRVVGKGVWFTINGPRRSRSGDRSGKPRNHCAKIGTRLRLAARLVCPFWRRVSGDRQDAGRPALLGASSAVLAKANQFVSFGAQPRARCRKAETRSRKLRVLASCAS